MSYDEQPDAPLHGECEHEIHTLQERIAELEAECERLRHKAELWNFGTVLGFPRLSAVEHTGQTAQAWHHKSHIVACDTAEKAMELAIKKESER